MTTTTLTFHIPRESILNANRARNDHWSVIRRRTAELRTIARMHARRITPVTSKSHVLVTYTYADRRCPRDDANLAPTTKALVDGLTDAQVWPDDSHEWVDGPDTRINRTPDPLLDRHRVTVTITITELCEALA